MLLSMGPLAAEHHTPLLEIYNHYIKNTPATFDTAPYTLAGRMPWYEQFDGERWHCIVGTLDGRVAGYACSARFRPKAAYLPSVETSVYLHPQLTGRGYGAALYGRLFESLAGADVHRAYACITLPNDASLALHRRFGFEQVARLDEVGRKFGRYWDVAYLEKRIA